jgi:hypothetical protein
MKVPTAFLKYVRKTLVKSQDNGGGRNTAIIETNLAYSQ